MDINLSPHKFWKGGSGVAIRNKGIAGSHIVHTWHSNIITFRDEGGGGGVSK